MIYFIRCSKTNNIKIGATINFRSRAVTLKKEHGDFEFLGWMSGDIDKELELHHKFGDFKATGQNKGREWFTPVKEILDFIAANTQSQLPEKVKVPRPAPNSDYTRKTKRIVPTAFYLGEADVRKRRETALNDLAVKLAKDLNISNRSQLIQKIADGEVELTPRPKSA